MAWVGQFKTLVSLTCFFVRRAPNRLKSLKSLKLAWRFVLTSCDIYQNPFTQKKILKFWQCRTKNLIYDFFLIIKTLQMRSSIRPPVFVDWSFLLSCNRYSLGTRNWNFSFLTCNRFRVGCKDCNNEDLR
jgi:hypothetical protein